MSNYCKIEKLKVCRKDLDIYCTNHKSCKFCDKVHNKSTDTFIPAKQTIKLMELGGHQIDFGKTFEYGKNVLKDLDKTIREYEHINNDPNQVAKRVVNSVGVCPIRPHPTKDAVPCR